MCILRRSKIPAKSVAHDGERTLERLRILEVFSILRTGAGVSHGVVVDAGGAGDLAVARRRFAQHQ